MVGMLQIITYVLAFYLVLKGIEILQIGVASNRENRSGMITTGVVVLIICIIAAIAFVGMQDEMAKHVSSGLGGVSS